MKFSAFPFSHIGPGWKIHGAISVRDARFPFSFIGYIARVGEYSLSVGEVIPPLALIFQGSVGIGEYPPAMKTTLFPFPHIGSMAAGVGAPAVFFSFFPLAFVHNGTVG